MTNLNFSALTDLNFSAFSNNCDLTCPLLIFDDSNGVNQPIDGVVDESNWGEGMCVRVPARMVFSMTFGKYCCPCFSRFLLKNRKLRSEDPF